MKKRGEMKSWGNELGWEVKKMGFFLEEEPTYKLARQEKEAKAAAFGDRDPATDAWTEDLKKLKIKIIKMKNKGKKKKI